MELEKANLILRTAKKDQNRRFSCEDGYYVLEMMQSIIVTWKREMRSTVRYSFTSAKEDTIRKTNSETY